MNMIFGIIFGFAACWYLHRYMKADYINTVENLTVNKQVHSIEVDTGKKKVESVKPKVSNIKKAQSAKPKASNKKKTKSKMATAKADDFTRFNGIGPKVDVLLKNNAIDTYQQFAKTDAAKLTTILQKGGVTVRYNDPMSWIKQAKFAAKADWDGLKKLQTKLKRERKGKVANAA